MNFIYHIATRADWERARRDGSYTTSTVGRTLAEEGFIHASQAAQVADVANRFYRGVPDLVVLVIDPDRVRAEIRHEHVPGAGAAPFPHIYGPLNADAVVAARPLAPGRDGTFTFDPAGLAPKHRAGLPRRFRGISRTIIPWRSGAPDNSKKRCERAARGQARTFGVINRFSLRGGAASPGTRSTRAGSTVSPSPSRCDDQTPSRAVSRPDLIAAVNSW